MLLNGKKFYKELEGYYQKENYEGVREYLEEQEKNLKCVVMPAAGLGCAACAGDPDEEGLTNETREWIINRNQCIAIVTYEQGRLLQNQKKWTESIKKYEDAKALMERNYMTDLSIYDALKKNIQFIRMQEEG